MEYINNYLKETINIIDMVDKQKILDASILLSHIKIWNGRLFIIGIGGGAGNASHAVNDFRKIMGIEAYAPTDNISEFSARINDNGWKSSFIEYLKISNLNNKDCILVFSGSGGNENKSENIVEALKYTKKIGAKIIGIVGGGYTSEVADICILIPTINKDRIYPHVEELQTIIFHLLVNK